MKTPMQELRDKVEKLSGNDFDRPVDVLKLIQVYIVKGIEDEQDEIESAYIAAIEQPMSHESKLYEARQYYIDTYGKP